MNHIDGWGLIVKRTNQEIGGLKLSVPPLTPRRGERLELESVTSDPSSFNQSSLCNEASIKTQKDGVLRASELVKMWRFGRVMHSEKTWKLPTLSP